MAESMIKAGLVAAMILMGLVVVSKVLVATHFERWGQHGPQVTFYGRYNYEHCDSDRLSKIAEKRGSNHWSCARPVNDAALKEEE